VGEVVRLFHAIQWLSDMQMDNIDFEVDSKIRKEESEFGHIIAASCSIFHSKFSNSQVEFIRRQANAVAHTLIGEATLLASPSIYYAIASCIESLIINEIL